MSSALASLPKVDRVLDAAPLAASPVARALKRRLVQEAIAELRARIQAGDLTSIPDAEALAVIVRARLDELLAPRPRRVINATGVVLHTNLGRAPLAPAAVQAMAAAAAACDLEIDLVSGRRGSRLAHLRPLLRALLGVDDVLVVNNGAAALLLACTALGGPGGLAIARGQMVEIGDGFRVAAMATAGGARLVEIGSTNRTHLADYRAALDGEAPGESGPATAILWVHLSNFRQEGFVHQAELAELAELARARGVPLIADLGSGSLGVGVPGGEPTIAEYAAAGADLVTFSGDKLLGGPQAGILAGRAALVERCGRHPMARALRPDKTTIAALHATAAAPAAPRPLRRHRRVAEPARRGPPPRPRLARALRPPDHRDHRRRLAPRRHPPRRRPRGPRPLSHPTRRPPPRRRSARRRPDPRGHPPHRPTERRPGRRRRPPRGPPRPRARARARARARVILARRHRERDDRPFKTCPNGHIHAPS